ncbi:hypothetical protein ABC345_13105 [Shouchella sp. 1P09AA]|uniref:hypothetical protein n=1 Tax=unclassified Shouchella TaxID=2893065 RepID=UPI00399F0EDC
MERNARYDRMVASAIHSRSNPQSVDSVERIRHAVPTLATGRYISENEIYSYGFAYHKQDEKIASKQSHPPAEQPLHFLKTHYFFRQLYQSIAPSIHALSHQSGSNEDVEALSQHLRQSSKKSLLSSYMRQGIVLDVYR